MNTPPIDALRVSVEQLKTLCTIPYRKAGVADAELITDLLIDTDLRGVLSHGTQATPGYIRAFLDGALNTSPSVVTVREDLTTAVVDGDGGLGHPAAHRATELAINKARQSGLGAAVSRNHGHFGSAGKYSRMAMQQDCIGFCVSGHLIGETPVQTDPLWNPLGNPPMSFGIPAGNETPLNVDMGASFFEQGEYLSYFEQMPAPFFKSLGLVGTALMMGGALCGMMEPAFSQAQRTYSAASYGAFIFVVDISRFVSVDTFKNEMDRSMRFIHDLPPMKGTERYDFPGGPEHDREKAWTETGIPLSDDHRQGLEDIAHELRVPIPWR